MKRFGRPALRIPQVFSALLVLGAAAVIAMAATPAPGARTMSVGEFAVLVASRLPGAEASPTPLTPESAAALLQGAGIKIQQELSAPMTEGAAADIFRQFNIAIEPRDAQSPLDPNRASSLIGIFGSTLSARGGVQAARTEAKAAGGASLNSNLPSGFLESIADCQSLPKTQDCQNCCRELLGGGNDPHTNRICGKACNTKARNVSASEPTP